MDCSPPGSSEHVILQARILGWVPFATPGDLPDPGIKPWSPELQADYCLSYQGEVITRMLGRRAYSLKKTKTVNWDFYKMFILTTNFIQLYCLF